MEIPINPEIDTAPNKDPWVWTFRAGTLAIQMVLLAIFYWASSHFVTTDEYKADKKEAGNQREQIMGQLHTIDSTLIRIDGKLDRDVDRDAELKDHEQRIRDLRADLDRLRYGTHP